MQEPFVEFFRYLPAPAFGALCVAVLGIDDGPKIAIIFIGTFFQQVLVIANTVRKVDPALIEAAQTLDARGWNLVWRVIIPASVSDIYTDMRILLGWAWTYLIVAEIVGTMSGITFFINQQARYRNFDNVYAAIFMIGIIGFATDLLLAYLARVIFPWKRRSRSKAVHSPSAHRRFCTRMSTFLPDYRELSPAVAERFARLKQRPVILSIRDLGKNFSTDDGEQTVFENVSLDIHRREFICVIGPSGCGKSTLVRIVAGLDEATGGEILLDDVPLQGVCPDTGMVFQGYTLFPWRTVKKNVMFGLEMQGKSRGTAQAEARQWLEMVGLLKYENAYPHELSGGMKQRVAIARALAPGPRILIMDEPFGALDAQTRAQMQNYLLQIWKKVDVTILFITHDLDEAAYLADRIVVMGANPGRVTEFIDNPVPRPRTPAQFNSPEYFAR